MNVPLATPSRTYISALALAASLALPGCEKPAPTNPAAPAAGSTAVSTSAGTSNRSRGWVCDMACEGCKTFDAPGKCPICKMDLRPYEEVPFAGQLKLSVTPRVGQPLDLRLTLADPAGCDVDPSTFDAAAGRTVQAAIVSIAPDYLGKPGVIFEPGGVVRLTGAPPTKPGKHLVVCTFSPPGLPPQTVTAEFDVAGETAPTPANAAAPSYVTQTKAQLRSGMVELENNPPQFFRGSENVVRVRPAQVPKAGSPVRLRLSGSQAAIVRADLGYAAPGLPLGDRTDELAVFRAHINEPGAYRVLVWLNTDQGADLAEFWLSAPHAPARPQAGQSSAPALGQTPPAPPARSAPPRTEPRPKP